MSKDIDDGMREISNLFVTCPHCGSNLCYHQDMGQGVEAMTCLACGFTTTNQMLEGSPMEKQVTGKHPSLYKDLRFVDVHGFVWYPSVITVPGVGMGYIDGTSKEDWEWVVTPVRKLTRKERRSGRYSKDQEYIAVPQMTKRFGKQGYPQVLSELKLVAE